MLTLSQRNAALNYLGVKQWYSNRVLVGAFESPDLAFEVNDFDQEVEGSPNSHVEVQSAKGVSAATLLEGLKLKDSSYDEVKVVQEKVESVGDFKQTEANESSVQLTSEPKGQAVLTPVESLYLRLYQWKNIRVVSDSAIDSPALNEITLLVNMLRACGVPNTAPEHVNSFSWPVFDQVDLSSDGAVSLDSLLEKWLSASASAQNGCVILMGSMASGKVEVLVGKEIKVSVQLSSSLSEMIAMPSKKAQVWRELLPQLSQIQEICR